MEEHAKRGSSLFATLCLFLSLLVLTLSLSACGGGGGSDADTNNSTSVSGVVADGYLVGATVCLDINNNKLCDPSEPQAQSGAGGQFTLTLNTPGDANYPLIAFVPAYAIDEDDGQQVGTPYVLYAPAGRYEFISPLTTLVHLMSEYDDLLTVAEAEALLKTILGNGSNPDTINIFIDYVEEEKDGDSDDADYARLHNIARVLVQIMMQTYEAINGLNTSDLNSDADFREFYNNMSKLIINKMALITQEINNGDEYENIDLETLLSEFTIAKLLAETLEVSPVEVNGGSISFSGFSGSSVSIGSSGSVVLVDSAARDLPSTDVTVYSISSSGEVHNLDVVSSSYALSGGEGSLYLQPPFDTAYQLILMTSDEDIELAGIVISGIRITGTDFSIISNISGDLIVSTETEITLSYDDVEFMIDSNSSLRIVAVDLTSLQAATE